MIVECVHCHVKTDLPQKVCTYHGIYYLCPICYQKFTEMFDEMFNNPETEEDDGV